MTITERLRLVPINAEHSADLFELWSDFEVIKFTYSKLIKADEECRNKIEFFMEKNYENETIKNFTVLKKNEAIGICGFPTIDFEKGEYGFYYQLCRKYWGNGFGYEVGEILLHYILRNTNATCIYSEAVPVNHASMAILKKLGFKEAYIEKDGFKRNDMILDLIHFKLIIPTA